MLHVKKFAVAGGFFIASCFVARSVAAQPLESPPPTIAPSAEQTPFASDFPTPTPASALPAGVVPASLTLAVTGVPTADAAFLEVQIRAALDRAIRPTLRFGASLAYGPIAPWPLPELVSGTRAAVNVTVVIGGTEGSAPVTGVTTVTLESVEVARYDPTLLFLSDDPEYLTGDGLVYRGSVDAGSAARLYYYHSDIGLPRDLDVVITADTAARVQLIASVSGPDRDVMSVGHAVTREFLRYKVANEGSVVDIVPGAPFVLSHALLLQGELVAGAVDVRVVSGGSVDVSVVASPAGSRLADYLSAPRIPFDGHRRHGAFELAGFGTIAESYTVGGPPVMVRYGGRTPTPRNLDPRDDGRNFGDYGIVRKITFTLDNPTADTHRVYLYEKPLAGAVRSTFLVDGQLKEIDCARLPQAYGVMTYDLAPHSTGATTTVTMTDGGSYYPLEFGVTDAQPLPYAPVAGAAESCAPAATPSPEREATTSP